MDEGAAVTQPDIPRESAARAAAVVFVVAATCGTLVSLTAVLLEPARRARHDAERDALLRAMVAGIPGVSEIVSHSEGLLEARVVDLVTGEDRSLDDSSLAAGGPGPAEEIPIPRSQDVARLGTRPAEAIVYVLRRDGRPELVILPVSGRGYGGLMRGYLALRGDLVTVAALTIQEHEETPGLGARIADPAWQGLWRDKQAYGPDGTVRLRVADGPVSPSSPEARHAVDAITGATRTSRGVTNMLAYWLGDHGFGPYLDGLRAAGGDDS